MSSYTPSVQLFDTLILSEMLCRLTFPKSIWPLVGRFCYIQFVCICFIVHLSSFRNCWVFEPAFFIYAI